MPDVLDRRAVAVRYLLEDGARDSPDEICVVFEDGSRWTRSQALREAAVAANVLREMGVSQGSAVAAALPNGPGYLRAWWGSALLGAAVVPFNTAYRGGLIEHLLDLAQPAVVVTTEAFRPFVDGPAAARDVLVLDAADLVGSDDTMPDLDRAIDIWDPVSLALTSGSTGPSKLVRVTNAHSMAAGRANFELMSIGPADTYLADVPMVHVSALYFLHACLAYRTRIVVRTRPSLASYWEVARDAGATVSQLYGTMVTYLEAQPPRAAEREHALRVVVVVPVPADPNGFATRFGVAHLATGYGSTEVACPIAASPDRPLVPGVAGQLLPGFEVRLVDQNDIEVGTDVPGEAIVRSTLPWVITTDYVGNPTATAEAWRNGWFHTGDLLRRDRDGNYFFVDRIKDAIRRRGQNISSFEVETVVRSYPKIAEVAVVAERSGTQMEDEVKAWITVKDGQDVDFVDLLRYCTARLAHYMVPRYFEVIDEFPRTPSSKIRKQELRDRGSSVRTWDRVAHGVDVTRFGVVDVTS